MMGHTEQKKRLSRLVEEFSVDESGATAIEYGLIVSMIFIVIVAAVRSVATSNSVMYDSIESALTE